MLNDLASQLERLAQLRAQGALSEDEFMQAKARLLAEQPVSRTSLGATLTRLQRRRIDRWVGGVAGGLAEATQLPAWTWRVLFVLLALLHGVGLVLYLAMWIFIPLEPQADSAPLPTITPIQ
jgi:phage shock protein C